MDIDELEALIGQLNTGDYDFPVFRAPLTPKVEFASVWKPEGFDRFSFSPHGHYSYLIKDMGGLYVAAVTVFNKGSDIGFVVKSDARRAGHLCNALKEVIFPDLVHSGRAETQHASFRDESGRHELVDVLNFTLNKDLPDPSESGSSSYGRAELSLKSFLNTPKIEHHAVLSLNDLLAIKGLIAHAFQRFDFIKQYLRYVQAPDSCSELEEVHLHLTHFQQAVDELLLDRCDISNVTIPQWLSTEPPIWVEWSARSSPHEICDRLRKSMLLCVHALYLAVFESDCASELFGPIKQCLLIAGEVEDNYPLWVEYSWGPLYHALEKLMKCRSR